jgi:hypothetical protein
MLLLDRLDDGDKSGPALEDDSQPRRRERRSTEGRTLDETRGGRRFRIV